MTCISAPASHRGAKGEHLFEGYFLEKGIFIAAPKYDLHRVDYVVEWNDSLQRVNVKTLHWVPTGNYYQADTKTRNGSGGNRPYTQDEIDYLGVVSLEYGHIWMVPLSRAKNLQCLRWHPPEKKHKKRWNSFDWAPYLINRVQNEVADTYTAKLR